MCCNPRDISRSLGSCDCTPVCCDPGLFVRRFRASKEEAERLEEYKEQLEKEIAGVDERIREIKDK